MRSAFLLCLRSRQRGFSLPVDATRSFGMSPAHELSMTASKKIDDLYGLIEGIETAMFTTRRPNGQLVSRPMATQSRIEGTDLWFVTDVDTHKLDELAVDPHVNCSYYNN